MSDDGFYRCSLPDFPSRAANIKAASPEAAAVEFARQYDSNSAEFHIAKNGERVSVEWWDGKDSYSQDYHVTAESRPYYTAKIIIKE